MPGYSLAENARESGPVTNIRDPETASDVLGQPTRVQPTSDSVPSKTGWLDYISVAKRLLIEQWLIPGIGLAILLAYLFPSVGKTGGAIRSEYSVKYGAIGIIFFITRITLSTRALFNQALNWRLHLITQGISFLLFSGVVYGIVWIIIASGTDRIDNIILSGLITMGVMPTTIASNVAMTRSAGGNVEAATVEVCVGNVLGTFITPSLLIMYLNPLQSRGFIQPQAQGGNGLPGIYSQMAKQLSICLFAPLIVGQAIQNVYPVQSKRIREGLKFDVVGRFLMLVLIWSTFCNKFDTGIFSRITHESVIMICFLSVALYLGMTAVCFGVARLPFLPDVDRNESRQFNKTSRNPAMHRITEAIYSMRFDKGQTAAICFCAAAKGLVLGAPLISIMYSAYDEEVQAGLTIPIALFQGTQITLAQLIVHGVKKWIGDEKVESSSDEAPPSEAERLEKAVP